uniref:SCP domain-containing protein n=1 Tax=Panagrellus redivivus TaxID=6233 RepID=A0A7E4W182_PANRE
MPLARNTLNTRAMDRNTHYYRVQNKIFLWDEVHRIELASLDNGNCRKGCASRPGNYCFGTPMTRPPKKY